MLIALDYDDTYTRDKAFWDGVIKSAIARGHSVICVTMRSEEEGEEVTQDLDGLVDDILFTNRRAKLPFTQEAGYQVSVWIDDTPGFITTDAGYVLHAQGMQGGNHGR